MDAWQGHERRQLLYEFQRREPNPRGAIGPRVREGVDEIAVGVLCETLQRHGTAGRIPDEPLQLIPPMGGDLGVGVQRKAMDAGTAGTGERGRLALGAKARADAPHRLPRAFAKGDTLLHRGRHGPGELGCVIDQRVISCGHGDVETGFQVSELPQFADDAPADLLDHVGDGGVLGGSPGRKRGGRPWSVRSR